MSMKKNHRHDLNEIIDCGYQNLIGFKKSDTNVIIFKNQIPK